MTHEVSALHQAQTLHRAGRQPEAACTAAQAEAPMAGSSREGAA